MTKIINFKVSEKRFELLLSGPKPDVLPLHHSPINKLPVHQQFVSCSNITLQTSVHSN